MAAPVTAPGVPAPLAPSAPEATPPDEEGEEEEAAGGPEGLGAGAAEGDEAEDEGEEEDILPEAGESSRVLSFQRQFVTCSSAITGPTLAGMLSIRERHMFAKYFDLMHPLVLQYVPIAGDLGGVLLSSFTLYYIGRKKSLVLSTLLFLAPLLIFMLDIDPYTDYLGVIIVHFAVRYQSVTLSVYVAEMADPTSRAFFLGQYFFTFAGGLAVVSYFPVASKFIFMLTFVLGVGSLVLAIRSPETPYWLALTDQREDAEDVFTWLRGGTADNAESFLMFNRAEEESITKMDGIVSNVVTSNFFLPLTLLFLTFLADDSICNLLGRITIDYVNFYQYDDMFYYEPYIGPVPLALIFKSMFPIIGCAIFLGFTFIFGRRVLYFGSELLSLSLFSSYALAPVDMTVPYMSTYSCLICTYVGGKQIPAILAPEIFPAVVRDLGVGSAELLGVLFQLFQTLTYDSISDTLYITSRSVFISVGLVLGFLFMPETRNLTLLEAEELGNDVLVRVVFFREAEGE